MERHTRHRWKDRSVHRAHPDSNATPARWTQWKITVMPQRDANETEDTKEWSLSLFIHTCFQTTVNVSNKAYHANKDWRLYELEQCSNLYIHFTCDKPNVIWQLNGLYALPAGAWQKGKLQLPSLPLPPPYKFGVWYRILFKNALDTACPSAHPSPKFM